MFSHTADSHIDMIVYSKVFPGEYYDSITLCMQRCVIINHVVKTP